MPLQDDICREKILRARKLTPEQRLADVFELSNHQFGMMHGGAMHRLGTTDEEEGWKEVARWMHRTRPRQGTRDVCRREEGSVRFEELAVRVIEAAEAEGVDFTAVDAPQQAAKPFFHGLGGGFALFGMA